MFDFMVFIGSIIFGIFTLFQGNLTMMDEELQRLLHIEEKMDNLYVALGFTSYSKYSAI